MDEKKQIEEMARAMCDRETTCKECPVYICRARIHAANAYNAGYRKQIEAEWVNNHCSMCGMMPIGDEIFIYLDMTPPRFELFMKFCPNCGARMG